MTLLEDFMAWRVEQVSIDYVERVAVLDHEEPLTNEWDEWRRLKCMVKYRDEIWTFCSPQVEWDRHMGWQGLILVRDGRPIEVCVTAQN
jgi:hypothetical protein